MRMMKIKKLNSKAVTSPQAVANYFFKRAQMDLTVLTPLQILKLVYIAYGWVLAVLNRDLFDEPIQAWKHGPVVPSIYHEFKHYGSGPIGQLSVEVHVDGRIDIPEISKNEIPVLHVLDKVWSVYGGVTGPALVGLTHRPGTPWSKCYRDGERHLEIPREIIKEHYQQIIGEAIKGAKRH
jgi:uncharacterized phage-associated protein